MRTSALAMISGILVAGGVFAATSAGGNSTSTIRLYEHDTSQANVDLGAAGDSLGDQFIFAGDVFDHQGGTRLGRASGTFTTVSTGPRGEVLCVTSFTLPDGQISGQGLFVSADLFGGTQQSFPITGGTGRYRHAQGVATVRVPQDVPDLADATFVLRLR
ncbi:MAG: hypothetical protein QOJ35_2980 [Solirubrobacteraceae bacterium]|jgi:hypothetical protein|nr:hypothetical protein [Solirubrobacteraceae bacterium]